MSYAVIGSGFAGLASSIELAKEGHSVHLIEKNNQLGGRARQFEENGFKFDMGPSWYWMPGVIENFFRRSGFTTSDFFELKKLNPAFQIIFNHDTPLKVPNNWNNLLSLFESIEVGAADKLQQFMKEAEYKYDVGINKLVYQPGLSITELLKPELIKGIFKLQVFSSFSSHVRKFFKDPRLIALMEFPILFLGAMPSETPALYSLMNYAGLKLGTYYPMGGFTKVIEGLHEVAKSFGVEIHTNSAASGLNIAAQKIDQVNCNGKPIKVQGVIGTADYHHIEQTLIPKKFRNYTESYWDKKVIAPSSLLFYLGVNKKVPKLEHHSLFFDEDFDKHAHELYKDKQWPSKPLFYVCCPSKTDPSIAPEGCDNLFVLMPLAAGLDDSEEKRSEYFHTLMSRLEKFTGMPIRDHLCYKKSYCISDFKADYNAYKGNAYGLANTLFQTANLKPKLKSKKIKNLFFAGQLTVPGPGVPPSIISGQVAAQELMKTLNH